MTLSGRSRLLEKSPIMLTIRFFPAARRIKKTHQSTKTNPPKDGDGKQRVLASSEKPRNDSPKDPKIAGLPPYLDEQYESVCKAPLFI